MNSYLPRTKPFSKIRLYEVQLRRRNSRVSSFFHVDGEGQFPGEIIFRYLYVCSKEPALETMPALARFGVDRTHGRQIERWLGFGNLIGGVFGLLISGNHKGWFGREVRGSWELDVLWFGGKVPFEIVCEPTSGTYSAKQAGMNEARYTHSEPNSQVSPVATFQHKSTSSRIF